MPSRRGKTPTEPTLREFLASDQGQFVAVASHRYSLGRMTGAVDDAVRFLLGSRDHLQQNTLYVIVRDTLRALRDDAAGWECDRRDWQRLVDTLEPMLDDRHRQLLEDDRRSWEAFRAI